MKNKKQITATKKKGGVAVKNKKAVVIISGGMDSTVLLYKMIANGFKCYALSFDYGQRHRKELEFAKKTCDKLNISHKVVDVTSINQLLQGSSLTSNYIDVPEGHYEHESMKQTVVPNRNAIMLSLAVGYAVSLQAGTVAFGAHGGDHEIYLDCREEFVKALNKSTMIANYQPVRVIAPFLKLDKGDIAILGSELGVNFAQTWTCYKGQDKPCGKCGACRERADAMKKAGINE